MNVRAAISDDASAIRTLITRALASNGGGDGSPDVTEAIRSGLSASIIARRIKRWRVLVAEADISVFGVAAIDANRVRMVFVEPSRQRQGVGTVLLDAIAQFARDDGRSHLEVFAAPAAQPFYAAFGYVPAGKFTDRGQTTVLMRKDL